MSQADPLSHQIHMFAHGRYWGEECLGIVRNEDLSAIEGKDLTVQLLTRWFPMVTELDTLNTAHFQYYSKEKMFK